MSFKSNQVAKLDLGKLDKFQQQLLKRDMTKGLSWSHKATANSAGNPHTYLHSFNPRSPVKGKMVFLFNNEIKKELKT